METQQWRNVSWNLSDVSEKDKVRTNLLAMTRLCIKVTVPLEMAIFKVRNEVKNTEESN